jgi:hypothetical protein
MESYTANLPCDGCGLSASPLHLADRVRRLELATRFRPVHIGVLFVAFAPSVRPEDDFYAPSESQEFFVPFLEGLDIASPANSTLTDADSHSASSSRLAEFQRRGYFLAHLSECPIPAGEEAPAATIARLAPTLIRRIRFNYKPKQIVPIGQELAPLVEALRAAGIGGVLTSADGQILPDPVAGAGQWKELFEGSVALAAARENLPAGYDRIPLTLAERKFGAGGTS